MSACEKRLSLVVSLALLGVVVCSDSKGRKETPIFLAELDPDLLEKVYDNLALQAIGGTLEAFTIQFEKTNADEQQLQRIRNCRQSKSTNPGAYAHCLSPVFDPELEPIQDVQANSSVGSPSFIQRILRSKRKTLADAQLEELGEEFRHDTLLRNEIFSEKLAKTLKSIFKVANITSHKPLRQLDTMKQLTEGLTNDKKTPLDNIPKPQSHREMQRLAGRISQDFIDQISSSTLSSRFRQPIPALEHYLDQLVPNPRQPEPIKDERSWFEMSPKEMLNSITKLTASMLGFNQDKNVKKEAVHILSPKFLAVSKDEGEHILSPSVLSLHKDKNALLAIEDLLHELPAEDRQIWLDFVMDATGAKATIDDLNEVSESIDILTNSTHIQSDSYTPTINREQQYQMELEPNSSYVASWQRFFDNITDEQHNRLDSIGYAFMDGQQLDYIYGADGPHGEIDLPFDKETYAVMSETEKDSALQAYFLQLAENYEELAVATGTMPEKKIKFRQTRQLTSPRILKTALTTARYNRALVLSPSLFAPLILNPSLLGPLILSPLVFSPVIVGPRVLSSLVLSPFVFSPFILAPFVLNPPILTPQLFRPVILSPLVLSPAILSPALGSPLVLSPSVLTPLILSPADTTAAVLSPRLLSPRINSTFTHAAIILSPAMLSKKK